MKLPTFTAQQSHLSNGGSYSLQTKNVAVDSAHLQPVSHGKRKICQYSIGYTNKGRSKSVVIRELLDRSVQHPEGPVDDDLICRVMAEVAAAGYENGRVKSYNVYTMRT